MDSMSEIPGDLQSPRQKKRRTAVSKRVRFDVFKRDRFTCQYCGAHPPAATLHVDHIHPVSEGGTNEEGNLVTSCDACNLGKGAALLSDAPPTLVERAALIAEREEQLRGYQEIMDAQRARLEDETWQVAEILSPGCSEAGFNRANLITIRRFIDQLGVHVVRDAAEIAIAKIGRAHV